MCVCAWACILGAFLVLCGVLVRCRGLGRFWAALGALLGRSWSGLGRSWGRLGWSWGGLGAVLGGLGAVLGRSWPISAYLFCISFLHLIIR